MKLIKNNAGLFGANCYIVYDEASREGIMIDPGGDSKGLIEECKKKELNIKYILLTHGHGDHIAAVHEVKLATNAKVLMSQKDNYLIHGIKSTIIAAFRNIKTFEADEYVTDGDIIKINGFDIEVLETPGHTPGGVCFRINEILFSGDTLFRGTIGRTDFEFGSLDALISSIKNKLLPLPDDTIVYPGHEGQTTIGYEKIHNPFLR